MRVVAVDPGRTTGLAWWHNVATPPALEELPMLQAIARIHATLADGALDHVVCEDFVITTATAKKSRQTEALDGLGALRYLAWAYGVPLKVQRSSEAETFAKNLLLRRVGWYRRGLPHARDASRHLLLFLVESGSVQPKTLLRARDGLTAPALPRPAGSAEAMGRDEA